LVNKIKNQNEITSLDFSPAGDYMAYGTKNKEIFFYDFKEFKELNRYEAHFADVNDLRFSNIYNKLFSAGDRSIKIWDFFGNQEEIFTGHHIYIWSISIDRNENYMVSGSFEDDVYLWYIPELRLQNKLEIHDESVLAVAINSSGTLIASGSLDRTIALWDITGDSIFHRFSGHHGNIYDLQFTPDDRYLLSASNDKNCKLWDIENKKHVNTFVSHEKGVMNIDFNSDGKLFLSASVDKSVKLWETFNGNCIYTYKFHENIVNEVKFHPSDSLFVSASNDGMVTLWKIEPEIFVYYHFWEAYKNDLESNEIWGPKRENETRTEFKLREERINSLKKRLINKYYEKYLQEKY
ncbi:WD40 repeat domain-containing protein, partial [Bacteroidota bacterium]